MWGSGDVCQASWHMLFFFLSCVISESAVS